MKTERVLLSNIQSQEERQASQKIEQIRHSGNMRPIFDGPNETLLRLVSGMAARAR